MKPAVYVNGRFLSQPLTGVQRYSLELVKALDRLVCQAGSWNVLLPRDAREVQGLRCIRQRRVGRLRGHAWDQFELGVHSCEGILVSLCGSGPILHPRQVVAIHDAAVFANAGNFSSHFIAMHRLLQLSLSRTADVIVTVSEFSRSELARHLPAAASKLRVVLNAADHILDLPASRAILDAHGLSPGSYIFALGSKSANKNAKLAFQALSMVDEPGVRLVLAGVEAPRVLSAVQGPHDPRVLSLGRIGDAEVRALYENALCFVFPSFYEGFGIPPLEAMICGCPVIVSDIPALRETCGDAALYCDPHDPKSLANGIRAVANDPDLRNRLRGVGLARAQAFSWDRSAAALLDVIREVRDRGPLRPN